MKNRNVFSKIHYQV